MSTEPFFYRINDFGILFMNLMSTTSRLDKEFYLDSFKKVNPEYVEDLTYILETLVGKHPIGWTFVNRGYNPQQQEFQSIKEMIQHCESLESHTFFDTVEAEKAIGVYGEFLVPIVNRTLKLGINKSLLVKDDITPMLAKKFDARPVKGIFAVTEKLDGNRCVAKYVDGQWQFFSRTGKKMNVNFNMEGFDTSCIYDGEVMSAEQTALSIERYLSILDPAHRIEPGINTEEAQLMFNKTTGLIARKGINKTGLIYNVFDIISDTPYIQRRELLNEHESTNDTRILPTLYVGDNLSTFDELLLHITSMGGEGIMLNRLERNYENKRTDALLKYKMVQTMDMAVVGILPGEGKYEGCVGALTCELKTEDGKHIVCAVGSGLTDTARMMWANHPEFIVGKIVTIGYHEITQDRANIGTNEYSLRFPRLITVREDKKESSEF